MHVAMIGVTRLAFDNYWCLYRAPRRNVVLGGRLPTGVHLQLLLWQALNKHDQCNVHVKSNPLFVLLWLSKYVLAFSVFIF